MYRDQYEFESEERIQAIQTIEKLHSVKKFFDSKAAFVLTFLVISFLLMTVAGVLRVNVENGILIYVHLPLPLFFGLAYCFSGVQFSYRQTHQAL